VKVLLIGLGGVGQRHARNLRTLLPDVDLLAYRVRGYSHVVTPKLQAEMGLDVEKALGIRGFSDLNAALAEKPQIAVICNPSSLHVSTAIACVKAGCDVLVEKPLADSLSGVSDLAQAAEETGRIVMVAYQLRFHPCVNQLASTIASGALGHLLSVRVTVGEYLPGWHPYEDYRGSYAARADLGGGVVLTQIHELDYLASIFGVPKRVFAMGGHWSNLEIDVEDTASALLEFSCQGRSLPVHIHQDYLQSPASRQCEVIGDRGKVIMDLPSLTVSVHPFNGSEPTPYSFPNFDRNQLFIDEMQHFLACVNERRRPIVDLHDGVTSLRMALAIKRSMTTGTLVSLDEDALAWEKGGHVPSRTL
jgi:predicted dehydrogenase